MKSVSAFILSLGLSIVMTLAGKAQTSQVEEFKRNTLYQKIFDVDAKEQLLEADAHQQKADGYFGAARAFERSINDQNQIIGTTRSDKVKIGAMKQVSKLKGSQLKEYKNAYKWATKANQLRYTTYQSALPRQRLSDNNPVVKQYGFMLERAATKNYKEAENKQAAAKGLEGDELRQQLSLAHQHEVLALNSLIDALRLYHTDPTLTLPADTTLKNPISPIKGFFFTVHVGIFNLPPQPDPFVKINPVYSDRQEIGTISYLAGVFKTLKDAEIAQAALVKEGFESAYVMAYENGKPMPLDRAIKLSAVGAVSYAIPTQLTINNQLVNGLQAPTYTTTTITKADTSRTIQPGTGPFGPDASEEAVELELYQSKASSITARLNLSADEKTALFEASQDEKYADNLVNQVEKELYPEIEHYKKAEQLEPDLNKKENYRDKRTTLEIKVFISLNKAASLYLGVNETRYKVYLRHLPLIRQRIESPAALLGEEYEQVADALYEEAKKAQTDARGLEYQTDKYLTLMDANDKILQAVENQETAFSLYFNLVTPDELKQLALTDTPPVEVKPKNKPIVERRLQYIVLETFAYSAESPKPKPLSPEKGVVFKIQIGLFEDYPEDKFGVITPITVEKLKNQKAKRFMVGSFKTYEAAKEALPMVRSKGYPTADIVAYRDGKRHKPEGARHYARQTLANYDELITAELAIISGKKSPATPTRLGTILATDLSKTTGVLFTVQLGVFKKILTEKELKTTENIFFERLDSGQIRYTKGSYSTKEAAEIERNKLIEKGFSGAWVVSYYQGKRSNLSNAENANNVKSLSVSAKEPNKSLLTFSVQVAALRSLSPELKEKLRRIEKTYPIDRSQNEKGLTVITLGNFESYDKAKDEQERIRNNGFEGCFVVAFREGKQIPIDLARKLQK